MQYPLRFSLAVQPTLDMHQAAGIGDDGQGGLCAFDIADLALEHLGGNLGVLDRENTAKPAALIGMGQFGQFQVAHIG